jgi:hypothetical protein
MSEYESALFSAVLALGQTLLESGSVSESALLDKLSQARSDKELMGSKNGAATLGHLIRLLGEPPTHYVPGEAPGDSN